MKLWTPNVMVLLTWHPVPKLFTPPKISVELTEYLKDPQFPVLPHEDISVSDIVVPAK
jgi:hypothetical protein